MSGSFPQLAIQQPDILGGLARVQGIQANRLQMLAAQQDMEAQRAFRGAASSLLPALGTAEGPQRQNILAKLAGLGPQGAGIALPMMQSDRENARFSEALRSAGIGGGPAPQIGGAPVPPRDPALASVTADLENNGMPLENTPRPAPVDSNYFARLMAAESGGNPNARNPRSTATGTFQFVDGTWRQFAQENPQLFQGMAPEQIMAARTDPVMSRRAAEWYAQRNARDLSAQGLPVNPGTIGLAHGFGAAGAATLLRANPNAPIESVMPPEVMTANPNLRGQTVGAVLQTFNTRFGAGGTPNASPQAAPGGQPPAPQRPGSLPTPEQLFALAASGNPRAVDFVRTVAPLVQRENPNWTTVTADGQVFMVNSRNPTQRIPMGSSEPGGGPYRGTSLEAQALNTLLAPNADPASPAYAAAFFQAYGPRQVQQPNGDVVTITPAVPPNIRRPVEVGAAPGVPAPQEAPPSGTTQTVPTPGGGSVTTTRAAERPLNAAELSLREETESALSNVRGARDALTQALRLSPQAYAGPAAEMRGAAAGATGFDTGSAVATRQFTSIMTEQALGQLRAIFGGNPTEGERAILMQMQASASMSRAEREALINRALDVVRDRERRTAQRLQEIVTGSYGRTQPGFTAPTQAPSQILRFDAQGNPIQ